MAAPCSGCCWLSSSPYWALPLLSTDFPAGTSSTKSCAPSQFATWLGEFWPPFLQFERPADFPGSVKGPYPSLVGEEPQGVALEALLGETALARFAQSAESEHSCMKIYFCLHVKLYVRVFLWAPVRVATSMFPPRKPSHLLHRTPFPSGHCRLFIFKL